MRWKSNFSRNHNSSRRVCDGGGMKENFDCANNLGMTWIHNRLKLKSWTTRQFAWLSSIGFHNIIIGNRIQPLARTQPSQLLDNAIFPILDSPTTGLDCYMCIVRVWKMGFFVFKFPPFRYLSWNHFCSLDRFISFSQLPSTTLGWKFHRKLKWILDAT